MPDIGGLFAQINAISAETPSLHMIAGQIAIYGVAVFCLLLAVGWWTARSLPDGRMAAVMITPLSVVIAYLVNQPIAHLIAEPRPFVANPTALVLIARSSDPSFPSDHAVVAGAACVALSFVSRRLGLTAGVVAIMVGAARVYVGVHYPIDVLAGLLLGGFVAAITWFCLRRPASAAVHRVRRTLIGAAVLR